MRWVTPGLLLAGQIGFRAHRAGAATAADVGLNPDLYDPWLRSVPSWGPREGFFVRPTAPPVPGAGPLALGVLSAVLVATAARLRGRVMRDG